MWNLAGADAAVQKSEKWKSPTKLIAMATRT